MSTAIKDEELRETFRKLGGYSSLKSFMYALSSKSYRWYQVISSTNPSTFITKVHCAWKKFLLATTYQDNKAASHIQKGGRGHKEWKDKRKKKDLWKVRRGLWDSGATFVGRENMICFISNKQDVICEIRCCFALLWGQGDSYRWGLLTVVIVPCSVSFAKLLLFRCLYITLQDKVESNWMGKWRCVNMSLVTCVYSMCDCMLVCSLGLLLNQINVTWKLESNLCIGNEASLGTYLKSSSTLMSYPSHCNIYCPLLPSCLLTWKLFCYLLPLAVYVALLKPNLHPSMDQ